MKYSTAYDTFDKGYDYNQDGIKFVITDRSCGISIKELDHKLHDGNWKCHIAETDTRPSVVAEANLITNVAEKAGNNKIIA